MTATINLCGDYRYNDTVRLLQQLYSYEREDEIILDIQALRRIELAPLAALLGVLSTWKEDKNLICRSHSESDCCRYMQRMNFFSLLGFNLDENFIRHDPGNRFLPFTIIDRHKLNVEVDVADQVVACIAPDQVNVEIAFTDGPDCTTGFSDGIYYSVSELVRNVQQHSMSDGYVSAQYYPRSGLTQVAIFDTGIGVRESFTRSYSPHAIKMSNDLDAINLALRPSISSKTHNPAVLAGSENAGVGLSLLTHVALQSKGAYVIASGGGIVTGDGEFQEDHAGYIGTLALISFHRGELANFQQFLENAKQELLGNQNPDDWEGAFQNE